MEDLPSERDVPVEGTIGSPADFQQIAAGISRKLGATTEATLAEAAVDCLRQLVAFIGADTAFAHLLDSDGAVVENFYWSEPPERARMSLPALGSNLRERLESAWQLLLLGHTITVEDLTGIELMESERAAADTSGMRSVIFVPVLFGQTLLGVVGTYKREAHTWDPETVRRVELLGRMLLQATVRTRDAGALAAANARAQRIAEHIPAGIAILRLDGTVSWASAAFKRMVASLDQLEGRKFESLLHPEDRSLFVPATTTDASRTALPTLRLGNDDDGWRWCDLSWRVVSEPESAIPDEIVVLASDAHERVIYSHLLIEQSERDPLTGLANRLGLDSRLEEMTRSGTEVLVAYCDLDGFKAVNDTNGHVAGDQLLRRAAFALAGTVRDGDVVARVGGDEFVIVVEATPGANHPALMGQRLVRAVSSAAGPDDGSTVTASIGLCGPGPAASAKELFEEADKAMYQAKREGKNRFIHRHWARSEPVQVDY